MKINHKKAMVKLQALTVVTIIVIVAIIGVAYHTLCMAGPTKDKVVIGCTLPLTGFLAQSGEVAKAAYDLATYHCNQNGGVLIKELGKRVPVELKIYDDESDPQKAMTLYEKLITVDKVDLLLAPFSSTIAFSVSTVTEKYRKVLPCGAVSSAKVYTRGFNYTFMAGTALSEQFCLSSVQLLAHLVDTQPTELQPRKLAILYEKEIYGQDMTDAFTRIVKTTYPDKLEIVVHDAFDSKATDLTPLILNVKRSGADALALMTHYQGTSIGIRNAAEQNLKCKIYYSSEIFYGKKYYDALGNNAEGMIGYTMTWTPTLDVSGARPWPWSNAKFIEDGKKILNRDAANGEIHYYSYGAYQTLIEAVERAGSLDHTKIANAMRNIENLQILPGFIKNFHYGKDRGFRGVNDIGTGVFQLINKELVLVWPQKFAERKLEYPVPPLPRR